MDLNLQVDKYLAPNEFIFTNEDIVVHTVLGTCIAIILYSEKTQYCGILHGMVPEQSVKRIKSPPSIEALFTQVLENFLQYGITQDSLVAKVFGGAQSEGKEKIIQVGKKNIQASITLLEHHNIPIIAQDLGGEEARKLLIKTKMNEIYLKYLKNPDNVEILCAEPKSDKDSLPKIKEKSNKIQVLIVDDSAVVRSALEDIFNSDPLLKVMGTAADPFFAAEKIKHQIPDVISLDIEMPRMDGITFLKKIMSQKPIPVVICSSLTGEGSKTALEALNYGAVEIITKPKMQSREYIEESRIQICDIIKAAAKAKIKKINPSPILKVKPKFSADAIITPRKTKRAMSETTEKLIAIGASTGGTEAISGILQKMPLTCHGIIIVQHMPEMFTKHFAERLNSICEITVKEAQNGDSVLKGHALIAPGNKHMLLNRSGARYFVEVKEGPLVNRHRPSVDVLFRSTATYAGENALGVILTGMGDDGAKGLLEMKEAKAFTIAQDEKSSVVFGMPKEAIGIGGTSRVLGLEQIPGFISTYFK